MDVGHLAIINKPSFLVKKCDNSLFIKGCRTFLVFYKTKKKIGNNLIEN